MCKRRPTGGGAPPRAAPYDLPEFALGAATLSARYPNGLATAAEPAGAEGLAADSVTALRAQHGRNVVSPPPAVPAWKRFAKYLTSPLQLLMWADSALAWLAFGLTGFYQNAVLAAALLGAIFVTAYISDAQERAASEIAAAIFNLLPTTARVRRGGAEAAIPLGDVVVGDVVHLLAGMRVPADMALLSGRVDLDLSALTGEAVPVEHTPVPRSTLLFEARSIAFSSSLVTAGDAWGVALKVGDATFIGATSASVGERFGTTTLDVEMRRVGLAIAAVSLFCGCVMLAIGLGRRLGVENSLVNAFVLTLVAVVPEGLPASVTAVFSLAATDLAKNNVYVKRAALLDTLGAASAVLTDKTGTLTVGRMTVSSLWVGRAFVSHDEAEVLAAHNTLIGVMATGRALSMLPSGDAIVHSMTSTVPAGTVLSLAATGRGLPPGKERAAAYQQVLRQRSILGAHVFAPPATTGSEPAGSGTHVPSGLVVPPAIARACTSSKGWAAGPQPTARRRSSDAAIAVYSATKMPPKSVPLRSLTPTRRRSPTRRVPFAPPHPPPPSPTAQSPPPDIAEAPHALMASWDAANLFTKLLAIAVVCNTASFAPESTESGGGSAPGMPPLTGRTATAPALVPRPDATGPGGEQVPDDSDAAPLVVGDASGTWGRIGPRAMLAAPSSRVLMAPGGGGGGTIGRALTFAAGKAPRSRKLGTSLARRDVLGDATEAALLRFCDVIVPERLWRRAFPVVKAEPFSSVTKTSSAVVELLADGAAAEEGGTDGPGCVPPRECVPTGQPTHEASPPRLLNTTGGGRFIKFIKGAPERVFALCSTYAVDCDDAAEGAVAPVTRQAPIDPAFTAEFEAAYARFGLLGERVIGFAWAECDRDGVLKDGRAASGGPPGAASGGGAPAGGAVSAPRVYTFAGLAALSDPPKPGAREAVGACRGAGVKVAIVTGDHPLTAETIARRVGVVTQPTAREVADAAGVSEDDVDALRDPRVGAVILSGHVLGNLSDAEWDLAVAKPEVVFARTTPDQKKLIVEQYQRNKHVVCVTGDGVNDAPALKRADVGISMGSLRASDVAKEAADVVIMDDDWSHVPQAILRGRLVYANVRKTIAYTTSHGIPELVPVLCLFLFDLPSMLGTSMLTLTIDLCTEQVAAISFVYEPAEAELMHLPPRDRATEHILDGRLALYVGVAMPLLLSLAATGAFFLAMAQRGFPISSLLYNSSFWANPPPAAASALASAVSGYYWTLVMSQAGVHAYLAKTSRSSIFTHGVFKNRLTLVGTAFSAAVAAIVIFALQGDFFGTGPMTQATSWTMPLVFALVALPLTEAAKACARARPQGCCSRRVMW